MVRKEKYEIMSDTENVAPCSPLPRGIGYFEVGVTSADIALFQTFEFISLTTHLIEGSKHPS